ncbi:JmjC domain-containing protein [Kribbella sp. CA-294648]|uniref:JmjC domain-containing protein n=1 Tax=Kribbella sp. CA-294648 TaxID=3239948 RepID=UPI003D8E9A81
MDSNLLALLVDDTERFVADHWLESPYLGRSRLPDPASLLSIAEMTKIFTSTALRGPHIRITKRGKPVSRQDYLRMFQTTADYIPDRAEPSLLLGEFAAGATIVIDRLEDFALPVREACDSLARSLATSMRAHAFITPAGETGFQPHHDPLGAFIVQVHGAKRWRVYERRETGASGQIYSTDEQGQPQDLLEPIIDTILRPGDVLYLPQGYPHLATAPEVMSVHITFVCQTSSWAMHIRPLIDEVLRSPEFLQIPNLLSPHPDDFHAQGRQLIEALARQIVERAHQIQPESPIEIHRISAVLEGLEMISRGGPHQVLVHPMPTLRHVAVSETVDTLEVQGAIIRLPHRFRPALQLLFRDETCLLSDLVAAVGLKPALALVSRLAAHDAISVAGVRSECDV